MGWLERLGEIEELEDAEFDADLVADLERGRAARGGRLLALLDVGALEHQAVVGGHQLAGGEAGGDLHHGARKIVYGLSPRFQEVQVRGMDRCRHEATRLTLLPEKGPVDCEVTYGIPMPT